jgi:hypothetical protein
MLRLERNSAKVEDGRPLVSANWEVVGTWRTRTAPAATYIIADEVQIDLDMLGPLVLHWVGGEVDRADVVAVDQRAPRERTVKLGEELLEPGSLRHAVGYDMVLRLGTRAGNDRLSLRRPGHQVAA